MIHGFYIFLSRVDSNLEYSNGGLVWLISSNKRVDFGQSTQPMGIIFFTDRGKERTNTGSQRGRLVVDQKLREARRGVPSRSTPLCGFTLHYRQQLWWSLSFVVTREIVSRGTGSPRLLQRLCSSSSTISYNTRVE